MTSLAADRTPAALPTPANPRAFRALTGFAALTTEAVRAARAYERAGTGTARRRVLAEFAAQRAA